jgi:hypothetical protein
LQHFVPKHLILRKAWRLGMSTNVSIYRCGIVHHLVGGIGIRNGRINGHMKVMLRDSRRPCWTSSRSVTSMIICDIHNCPQTCHSLHTDLMKSIAVGLNLKESFFDDKVNKQCHNLRLLSYPPITRSLLEAEGQARAGAHSGKLGWHHY